MSCRTDSAGRYLFTIQSGLSRGRCADTTNRKCDDRGRPSESFHHANADAGHCAADDQAHGVDDANVSRELNDARKGKHQPDDGQDPSVLQHSLIASRAALRTSTGVPLNPPPCAMLPLPPPLPPNRFISFVRTAPLSIVRSCDRATTTSEGDSVVTSTTAVPGFDAIVEASDFKPFASQPDSASATSVRPPIFWPLAFSAAASWTATRSRNASCAFCCALLVACNFSMAAGS